MNLISKRAVLIEKINAVDLHVGTQVRLRRIAIGLDAAVFAHALQVDVDEVLALESGHKRFGAELLRTVAEVLKTPVSCFFDDFYLLPASPPVVVAA